MATSLDLAHDQHQVLGVDPFGSMPDWASRIPGLGGPTPPVDPGYVFRTLAVRPATGLVTATIRFHDLEAESGTLLIDVAAVPSIAGATPARMRTIEVPLEAIIADDGEVAVEIEAKRNTQYTISGYLRDDEGVFASAIVITVDRREQPGDHGPGWRPRRATPLPLSSPDGTMVSSWLTRLETPILELPRSQPFTERQTREPSYRSWMRALGEPAVADERNWAFAFVLQVLKLHGAIEDGADGLGFLDGGSKVRKLPSYLAGQGCQLLVAEHLQPGEFALDPALAVESLYEADLCEREAFIDLVHHSAFDLRLVPQEMYETFDFLWSIGINRAFDSETFHTFIQTSMNYLRPGGIAVHVFDYRYASETGQDAALSRVAIERSSLVALSHLNDVAQLLFRRDGAKSELVSGPCLYGLVLRKGMPL